MLKSRRAPAECLVSTVRKYTKWALGIGGKRRRFEDLIRSAAAAGVSHCLRTEPGKFTMANSNPQVFRLNLLNFLNAAPLHAPMLPLAIIYKVSHHQPPNFKILSHFLICVVFSFDFAGQELLLYLYIHSQPGHCRQN